MTQEKTKKKQEPPLRFFFFSLQGNGDTILIGRKMIQCLPYAEFLMTYWYLFDKRKQTHANNVGPNNL